MATIINLSLSAPKKQLRGILNYFKHYNQLFITKEIRLSFGSLLREISSLKMWYRTLFLHF